MFRSGYYTKRLKKSGNGLEWHFFEPSVLEKYRNDPGYELRETSLGTASGSGRSSGLQQYVWGHKADGTPCVAVFLAHLRGLHPEDQLHWRLHELRGRIRNTTRVDRRYYAPLVCGRFPDTISIYDALHLYLVEIQKVFQPDVLFPQLLKTKPVWLAPIDHNSRKAMLQFAQCLSALTKLKLTVLAKRVTAPELQKDVKEALTHQRSGDLIRLYFTQHDPFPSNLDETLAAMKELTDLRVQSAHTNAPAVHDQNYREMQIDLVGRLQNGLRVMMLCFAEIEKGPQDTISSRVLGYRVVIY